MKHWLRYLVPRDERQDPVFKEEVSRLAVVGLRAGVLITVVGPALMLSVTAVLVRLGYQSRTWLEPDLAMIGAGTLAWLLVFSAGLRAHARFAMWLLGYAIALIFIATPLVAPDVFPGARSSVPTNIILVMLVAIAAAPFRPLQTLGLGLAVWTTYVAAVTVFPERAYVEDETPLFLAALIVIILVCTGLTAVIYHQRAEAFKARQLILKAQAVVSQSKSAAAQGRLAAALSHELNSPVGIINSNVDSLSIALGKELDRRTVDGLRELAASAKRSCRRIAELVARMQRVTNLDRADEAVTDLTALIMDTVELLRPRIEGKRTSICSSSHFRQFAVVPRK